MKDKGLRLKICGMRDADNIAEVCALGVDYLGFIFYKHSPRYVGKNFSMPSVPASTKRVGVFVNEPAAAIARIAERFGLDLVQLHGNESPEVCAEIRQVNVGVIKTFSVGDDTDFKITAPYHGTADYFLFDTKGKYFGGNGIAFNWDLLQDYDQVTPFFLSGGLTRENIAGLKRVSVLNLYALDFNSGVEISAGLKDIEKVSAVKRSLANI